jgi:hypothetical protein
MKTRAKDVTVNSDSVITLDSGSTSYLSVEAYLTRANSKPLYFKA